MAIVEALNFTAEGAITDDSITTDSDGDPVSITYNFQDGTALSIDATSLRSVFETLLTELLQKCALTWKQLCDLEGLIDNFLARNGIDFDRTTDGIVRLSLILHSMKRDTDGVPIARDPTFYNNFVRTVNQRVDINILMNLPGNTGAITVQCWRQVNICLRTQFSDTHRRHHCARGVSECQEDVMEAVNRRDFSEDARLCALLMRQAAARLVLIRG